MGCWAPRRPHCAHRDQDMDAMPAHHAASGDGDFGDWFSNLVGDDPTAQVQDMYDLLSELEPPEPQPLALANAAAPGSAASLLALLQGGGDIPESARAGLIHLLVQYQTIAAQVTSNTPAAQMGNVRLIQSGIAIPNPALGEAGKSSFPHIVELNGALSAEDEACEWQQYKTKTTHIKVQLQDAQGAPPPIVPPREPSGPRSEAAAYQSLSLASNRHALCLWQASLSWEARCRRAAWSFS